MQGPLSGDIYRTDRAPDSWWRFDSVPLAHGPAALDEDLNTEVAIIGGGYAGLSCARRLAEHGIGSVVLDAGDIGWGASGRNGGIVGLSSHKLSDRAMLRRYGAAEISRATRLQCEGAERLRAFCTEHGVPMQGGGEVVLAHSPRALRHLSAEAAPEGIALEPIPPSGQPDLAQFGGIRIRPGFGIHPIKLVRALALAASEAGVRVCPQSEVLSWEAKGNGHRLITPGGTVSAHRVVLATNGFTPDGLHPAFDGRAVPVISNIAVTRVLTEEERARHAWLGADPVADTRNLLVYLRMLPEGRLLFGMRGDLTGADAGTAKMKARIAARIAACFPGWAGIETEFFWRGPICATARYTPAIGRLADAPTVYHAFGWHGSGVNGAQVGARLLADVIAGAPEETIPAPWRGPAPRLPLPGLRPVYVGLALMQQRLQDVFS